MYGQFRFIKEVLDVNSLPPQTLPEFVFWGRSNVGKSSLINSITNSNIAKISKTPGRTRSLVFFESERKSRIVDFPGYGYSKIPKNNEYRIDNLIEHYLNNRKSIKFLFAKKERSFAIYSIKRAKQASLQLSLAKIYEEKKNRNFLFREE